MTLSQLQDHYNVYQDTLPLDLNLKYDQIIGKDSIVHTVLDAIRDSGVIRYVKFKGREAHGYTGAVMLRCVLLGMTIRGYCSVRDYEDLCANDARFLLISGGLRPSHMAFQRFIHDDLTAPAQDIFYEMNKYIEKKDKDLDTDVLYIDGTKYEANANKMTFVWMAGTKKRREKLWKEAMEELKEINRYLEEQKIPLKFSILREITFIYLYGICENLKTAADKAGITFVYGKGKRKNQLQRYYEKIQDYAVRMMKYQMHFDIAGERNSFSKTDPDATFMHMKYDYYNHTNVFKPGYNVQMGSSGGYIRHVYISADPNDVKTYIPFMDGYYRAYGKYPKKTPADAGYGSYDNYTYCFIHNIDLYLKYSGQEKKKEKVTDKNRFKAWAWKRNVMGMPICPAGHVFHIDSTRIEHRGVYPKQMETLSCDHCTDCPLKAQCTKSKDGRKINRCRQLEHFQTKAEQNMATDEGSKLMTQRSIWSEGIFGCLKEDWSYDKLHRRGNSNVQTEILLVCIGHNLRRLHLRLHPKVQKENTPQPVMA